MISAQGRAPYAAEHHAFRDTVRRFLEREFTPNLQAFEEAGLLCPTVSEDYGGPGLDFSFSAVINEELSYAMASDCLMLQSDIFLPYLQKYGSEAQKARWLPKMVTGEVITAIAMTEPGTGSDLQGVKTTAVRDGDVYVVNGSKTYITNGQNADLILTVVKTDPTQGGRGTSLLLVEADSDGFSRGRNLDKVGQWSADTSELFFDQVRVDADNLLGVENQGFLWEELRQSRDPGAVAVPNASAASLEH